jgi:hypothetical protein
MPASPSAIDMRLSRRISCLRPGRRRRSSARAAAGSSGFGWACEAPAVPALNGVIPKRSRWAGASIAGGFAVTQGPPSWARAAPGSATASAARLAVAQIAHLPLPIRPRLAKPAGGAPIRLDWGMRLLLAIGAVCVIGAGLLAFVLIDPLADESDPTVSRHLSGTACERLAGLAGQLAEADDSVDQFLLDLGQQAAGISKGRRALADLARGGRNRIRGRGFKRRFDDGSVEQVRHFAGYVRASMFGGTTVTRWIGERLRRDPPDSPDGRLGDEGIEFAQDLIAGRLELSEASGWLRSRLCRPAQAAGG